MIYCFDIDDTICKTRGQDYANAEPNHARISKVNLLHSQGHTIKIFTARGSETGIDWRSQTEQQLIEWGCKYDVLLFGKPAADLYIDDKGCKDSDFDWTS